MNERPDAGTAKRHEDLAPIWVRLLPAPSTMTHWTRSVNDFLKAKTDLDRRKARPLPEQMETS